MPTKSIGLKIRDARIAKKLNQDAVAEAAGVTRGTVSQWENGIIESMKAAQCFAVCDLLDLDPRELATGKTTAAQSQATDIPQHRIDLIRTYGRLPPEIRTQIRGLIETLGWFHHPDSQKYVKTVTKAQAALKQKQAEKA